MTQLTINTDSRSACAEQHASPDTLCDWLNSLSQEGLTQLHTLLLQRLSRSDSLQVNTCVDRAESFNLQRLTARECEVLTLVASGYTRSEVAAVLHISPNTAATHIANLYRKLEVESIAEATRVAIRSGMVC